MKKQIEDLARKLGSALAAHGWMAATAESCTGGGVAYAITAISGSSAWFDRSFVTYTNEAKQELLGVQADTLQRHGAVSEAVVKAMLQGIWRHSHAQVAVAISGIAGPSGGTSDKPVGTVWLAWGAKDRPPLARCYRFDGDREAVREQAIAEALTRLCDLAR